MEQISIPSQEIQIPTFDEQFQTVTEDARKRVLISDSSKGKVGNGQVLIEHLQNSSLKNKDQLVNEGADSYLSNTDSLDADLLSEVATQDPSLGLEVVEVMDRVRHEERSQDPLFLAFKQNILDTPGSENLSPKQIRHHVADQLHLYALAEAWDKMGLARKIGDFANILLWPDYTWNVAKLGEGLSEEFGIENLNTNLMSQMDLVKGLVSFRRSLDGEALLAFDEKTREILDEIELSVLQKTQFIEAMVGNYSDLELDLFLDKADIAIMVGTAGLSVVQRILRAGQLAKRLADSGDIQGAATVAKEASIDEQVAHAMGQSQVDAASIGNPMVNRVDIAHAGMPEGPSSQYRHYLEEVDSILDRAENIAHINLATETPEEAARIAAALRKHMPEDLQVENVKFTQKDGQTLIEYDIIDDNGLIIGTENLPYTLDEVGMYLDHSGGLVSTFFKALLSPAFLQGQDARQLVDSALVGTMAKAKLGKIFTDAAEAALKPIKGNKGSMERLSKVLNELDGKDIVADYHLLTNVGVGGTRLTDKEFTSFLGVRRVLDDIWENNNRTMRQELELSRAKAVRDHNDELVFGKAYEDPTSAEGGWHSSQTSTRLVKITDDGADELKGVSLKDLEDAYADGFVLVRSHAQDSADWFRAGERGSEVRYQFALVQGDRLGRLPTKVMNRVPNYLPKLNKGANFFIKEQRMLDEGGRELVSKPITLAYAATRRQADTYLEGLRKADAEIGIERSLEVTEDVLKTSLSNGDVTKATGGLVRGKRSKKGIDYAGDFGGGRADPLSAITRAINLTADRVAMSRWRMSEMDRWYNSAKHAVPNLPADWLQARTAIEQMSPSATKTKLLNAHDHISDMRMIPTKSEKMFQGAIVSMAKLLDKSSNPFLQRSAAFFYQIKDHNPVGLIKSMSFNLTLGTFSMVQIPVQAFGTLVAIAANPVYAGRAMSSWIMASGLDLGRDMKVVKETAGILGKRMGMKPEEIKSFQHDYEFWRASGMREAVVRGNSDATSMMNGLPMDAGMLRRGAQAFFTAGQTPYRMGELINMRISFFTALERQKAVDGVSFLYDNNTMKKVLARAEHYRMNMNAANKAAYQRGIWALPTQFKQIYTKYIEALAGKEFTKAEKLRILGVQAGIFGAAGIPILNHYTNEVVKMTGITETDVPAEVLTMIQHGAWGHVMNNVFDIDMASSGRLTVSADLIDEITKIFIDGQTPMLEMMMGASGTPMKHGAGFFSSLLLAGNMVYDAEEVSPELFGAAAKIASDGLLRITSSGRKYIEAKDLASGFIRKSDGAFLYEVADPKLRDILVRGFGFGSLEVEEYYKTRKMHMDITEERTARVDQLISAWYAVIRGVDKEDRHQWMAGQLAASMVESQIAKMNPADAALVRESFQKKLLNRKDPYAKVIMEAIDLHYSGSVNAFTNALPTIHKERQRQAEMGSQRIKEANK